MNYVYIKSESGEFEVWTVGFYDPAGKWIAESDHSSSDDAAMRTAWLNGGRLLDGTAGLRPSQHHNEC